MNLDILTTAMPPWLYFCVSRATDIEVYSSRINERIGVKLKVIKLRGNKMRNWSSLFDEFSAALQFPDYFGENLNAFDECIQDLDWFSWLDAQGFLLVILRGDETLIEEPNKEEEFQALLRHLNMAAESWAKPIKVGGVWDRDAKPFHVLFHIENRRLEYFQTRLKRVSININKFDIGEVTQHKP